MTLGTKLVSFLEKEMGKEEDRINQPSTEIITAKVGMPAKRKMKIFSKNWDAGKCPA